MRIDKYLKVSRIIKRRTVAKSACEAGRVFINDIPAKAGATVRIGDIIRVEFGTKNLIFEVLKLDDKASKSEASDMYSLK